jgi:hypothetical protein
VNYLREILGPVRGRTGEICSTRKKKVTTEDRKADHHITNAAGTVCACTMHAYGRMSGMLHEASKF